MFDANRESVLPMYMSNALLTFEGWLCVCVLFLVVPSFYCNYTHLRPAPPLDEQCMGQAAIAAKLGKLTFQRVVHSLTKIDSQPTPHNGVMVLVTGQLQVCVLSSHPSQASCASAHS
jgi:hypothetical protein